MVSRSLTALVAFLPVFASANPTADEMETWTVAELCAARDSQYARDELERREVFDRRELRDIQKARVESGISEDVLLCLLGTPDAVSPVLVDASRTVDALAYYESETGPFIVHVDREGDDATVVSVASDPGRVSLAAGSRFTVSGLSTADTRSGGLCGRQAGGRTIVQVDCDHARAYSIQSAVADSTPSLPSQ